MRMCSSITRVARALILDSCHSIAINLSQPDRSRSTTRAAALISAGQFLVKMLIQLECSVLRRSNSPWTLQLQTSSRRTRCWLSIRKRMPIKRWLRNKHSRQWPIALVLQDPSYQRQKPRTTLHKPANILSSRCWTQVLCLMVKKRT